MVVLFLFMDAHIYILYSAKIDKFYIGSTELEPKARLDLHLNKKYGQSKYTAQADDWTLFFSHPCEHLTQAKRIEAHIKKMKSKVYILNLKKYPEMITRLLISNLGSSR